jgi:hypothetical protein
LRSVLAVEDGPRVKADASFFAMGSCFAVRIADYLREAGRDVSIFDQAEELSSPISNALLLYVATLPPQDQVAYLTKWIALLFAEESEAEQAARVRGKIDELLRLAARARTAQCVILTLGNVLDFFVSRDTGAVLANAAPKFMAALADERLRPSDFAERLISRGAIFRMATYAETLEAIGHCLRALRILTPAPIVITVSPVPITAAYGLTGAGNRSAIEIDCISKSRLRSALDDVLTDYEGVFYFPAFEIVRWIAPVTGVPTFGTEDATSRHVSSAVVDAICQLFLTRFLRR